MSSSPCSSSDKNARKALKKLRDIEALKSRKNRSQEEEEKIGKEVFYRRMLDPTYKTEEEKEQEQRKNDMLQKEKEEMKQRQYERHKKNQKKKLEYEAKERKRREEEEAKEKERAKEWAKERAKEWAKERERTIAYCKDPLEKEYLSLLIENNNDNGKTFRMMSRKYHPDKNLDKKKWAEEKQKQLQNIRSKYENNN